MRITRNDDYWKYLNMRPKKANGRKNNQSLSIDQYMPSDLHVMQTQKKKILNGKECTKADLDYINFENETIAKLQAETIDTISVGNREYYIKDLPEVEYERGTDIRAKNNKIVLENKHYYRFQDNDGCKHVIVCNNNHLERPYADYISGKWDEDAVDACLFWNQLSYDSTYIGLHFSREKEKQMLNDAGITEGFFSVQIGKCKQEYYYSNGTAGQAVKKSHYDAFYNSLVDGTSSLCSYEIGKEFWFGGNKYVLNEDRKFDIPYGEDIYDMRNSMYR